MAGHKISTSRLIDAPAAAVWEILTNVQNAPQVLSAVTEVEVLTDGPYSVGTRWRETRKIMGKEETQEMWVTEAVANRRTVVRAEAGGAEYATVFRLSPVASRTELEVTFSASTPHPTLIQRATWLVFGPLGAQLTKRMLKSDLAQIAAAAEG